VAAVLALAEAFAARNPARTLRFVAFVNEEPPFAHTPSMGSVVYATRSRERGERITAMVSLETMGYFADAPGSQRYPSVLRWVYPDSATFIAFVSDPSSRTVLKRAIKSFREVASVPSEGGALPANLPGVGWSDHWSFWQADFPAIMVTDTALFRYPAYHTNDDTPDQVDYERLARVVAGLEHVVADLAE
jgi:Zn-dependent M28 family amino/carboxypeptidase